MFVGQQRANNAVAARTILERVTGVRVAQQRRIHQESPRRCRGVEPDPDRIEVASEVKLLRALGGWDQHFIEVGHRPVVYEGRCRPDPVTRGRLVDVLRRPRRGQFAIAVQIRFLGFTQLELPNRRFPNLLPSTG